MGGEGQKFRISSRGPGDFEWSAPASAVLPYLLSPPTKIIFRQNYTHFQTKLHTFPDKITHIFRQNYTHFQTKLHTFRQNYTLFYFLAKITHISTKLHMFRQHYTRFRQLYTEFQTKINIPTYRYLIFIF